MNKISIQEITEIVANEAKQTKKFSEQFLRELVSVIAEYLQKDGIVKVKGLGTFKVVAVEERKSVDVASGKEIILPAHNKIQFTAENSVKQTIKGQDSNHQITESPHHQEKGQELVDKGQELVDKGQDSNHQITESPHHHSYWIWLILIIVIVDLAALAYVSVPYWKPYFDSLMENDEFAEEIEYHYTVPVDKERAREAEAVVEESGDTVKTENTEVYQGKETQEPAQAPVITLENYTYKTAMEVPVRETVTVIDGSRLTMIAYRAYGSKDFWVYVYDANRDVLRRPKDIAKGMTIKIADLPLSIVDPNNPACIEKARELAGIY
ncbi:MAG: HU family DNA-binding protein [Paludibacteraceae bacterium]|nr:HU family DNA-binding protein [Paludibacteraceae bacterium]